MLNKARKDPKYSALIKYRYFTMLPLTCTRDSYKEKSTAGRYELYNNLREYIMESELVE